MIGYQLVEERILNPPKADGIPAHAEEIGLLDFLRDLAEEHPELPKFYKVQVVGLEEVLFAARPDELAVALAIHQRLRAAAQFLENRLASVQIVFRRGTLRRGASLWVEYRGQTLPIDLIFGSPHQEHDPRGNPFYRTNFNLTNA